MPKNAIPKLYPNRWSNHPLGKLTFLRGPHYFKMHIKSMLRQGQAKGQPLCDECPGQHKCVYTVLFTSIWS